MTAKTDTAKTDSAMFDSAKFDYATMIANRLRAAEHALDAASAEISLLSHDMTRHRAEAGFAADAGHGALVEVLSAQTALVEARGHLVASHASLARTARRMGVRWTMGGPGENKDEFPRPTGSFAVKPIGG